MDEYSEYRDGVYVSAPGIKIDVYRIVDVDNLVLLSLGTIETAAEGSFNLPFEKGKTYYLKLQKDK